MLYLITGASGSGKSEYAENLAMRLNPNNRPMVYIATMSNVGKEASERIRKHRKMRRGKGFNTVESLFLLSSEMKIKSGKDKPVCILLEDLSNLLSNYMFVKGYEPEKTEIVVKELLLELEGSCDNLIIVTNEVFSDGIRYDETVLQFLSVLSNLNKFIANLADFFTEVVVGIPVDIKKK